MKSTGFLLHGCLLLLNFVFNDAKAQDSSLKKKSEHFLKIIYDNDLFHSTDYYYTQGIRFEYTDDAIGASPFSRLLLKQKSGKNYYSLIFEQDCFTPTSILLDTINRSDRPFAGTIVLSQALNSLNAAKKIRLYSKIDLGMIGSCAECEATQKTIHRYTNNDQPHGWGNQLSNSPVLNYEAEIEKGLIVRKYLNLLASGEIIAGTLIDNVGVGMLFRLGLMNSYFSNPGLAKTGNRKFQMYLTAKGNAKMIAYNGTLQGSLFGAENYFIASNKIERFLYSYSFGAVIAFSRVSFEFQQVYLSPEFVGGLSHGWGSCRVFVCF